MKHGIAITILKMSSRGSDPALDANLGDVAHLVQDEQIDAAATLAHGMAETWPVHGQAAVYLVTAARMWRAGSIDNAVELVADAVRGFERGVIPIAATSDQ